MTRLLIASILLGLALLAGTFAGGGVALAGAPNNDSFNNATRIEKLPYNDATNTQSATTEQNEPDIGACSTGSAGYSHSVWYEYTPGFTQSLNIDTFGSSYDTVLAVFSGAKGSLSQRACNDDSGGQQSAVKVSLDGGTTYHILAAAWAAGGAGGALQVQITPQDPDLFDGLALKCYQAKFAKRSARFTRQEISTIDLNFHFEATTSVNALSLFCNQAQVNVHKSGGEEDLETDDIKVTCFTARDTELFSKDGTIAGRRVFAHNTFGDNNLVLGRLESVCVPAVKASGQLPNLTPFNNEVLRCYTARPVKGAPRFQQQDTWLYDQFDAGKDARVLRPVSFCTLSGKSDVVCSGVSVLCPGGANGSQPHPEDFAVVCYALRQASFPSIIIPVIDQFIDQQFVDPELRITKADRLCVSGDKKSALAPNDEFSYPTAVDLDVPCGATVGPCAYIDHVVTMKATSSRNDPRIFHCESVADSGVRYGHSVWYTFTPQDENDALIKVATFGSTYDTVIAVYTGSKGNLTQIDCNDDHYENEISFLELDDLEVGQKYYFMVGAVDRSPGGKLKFIVEHQCTIAGPC